MVRLIKLSVILTVFLSALLSSGFGEGISPARAVDEIAPAEASAPVATCEPDTPDMVAYWPLDDGAGSTTFEDVVGVPPHPGSCLGGLCPVSTSGKINSAFQFNGNNKVTVENEVAFDFGIDDSFSFEMWVKTTLACPTPLPEEDPTLNNKVFIGKWSSSSSWWVGCSNSTAAFSLRSSVGTAEVIYDVTDPIVPIHDDVWHHVVAVREATGPGAGEGVNRLYVDGIEVATASHTYTGTFVNSESMTMGFHDNRYFYDGVLDEVAIYNRALTSEEIQFHYLGGDGQSYCITPLQVVNPGDKVNNEGETIPPLQIQSTSEPGTTVIYSVSILPPDLILDVDTGLITGTLTYEASAGSPYTVQVTATNVDDPSESDSKSFSWTVNNVNRPPEIANIPGNQNHDEGETISLPPVSADDPDGDLLTFSASNLPPDLSIDQTTGLISGTIAYNAGEGSPYTVTVTVSDNGSPVLTDEGSFTWIVSNINDAPVVTNPGNKTNKIGDSVSLQIVATDPDGDPLTYSTSGLPDGLSINLNSGLIGGVPSSNSAGTHTVEVTVWDGFAGNEVTVQFTWTIEPEWQVYLPLASKSGK